MSTVYTYNILNMSSICWSPSKYNLHLINYTIDRCHFRYLTLDNASNTCESINACGGITRDEGLRCGSLGLKMHYELRSGVVLHGAKPPFSWLIRRNSVPDQRYCSVRPIDSRPNETPRERWLRQHKLDLNVVNVSLLVSGTLRGYLTCSKRIARALVDPNPLAVTMTVVTYDKNDCGGSSGHGLGMTAQSIDINTVRSTFGFKDLPLLVYNMSARQIDRFFHMNRNLPNIFHNTVDRGAMVRYQSQFYLRYLAWKFSKSSSTDAVVSLRPDAYMYGMWKIRRQDKNLVVSIDLRDATTCTVKIGASDILLLHSDIHRGNWDDTFALGFGSSIHKYVNLYKKLSLHQYYGPFPHPESLLEHHLEKQGLHIVDACGAARGDVLELIKKC